ncbi:hypothetical protein NDU88_007870 [Pleurodeles waltl]|uniref:Uncharacterized protein n=1 Tax=Pleurodeles waltl TaxID=8319 RepID=A0AAV7N4X0_PLEWA|nr:hypothetical protein NDU88_007870 [Pleurodeles waltl]
MCPELHLLFAAIALPRVIRHRSSKVTALTRPLEPPGAGGSLSGKAAVIKRCYPWPPEAITSHFRRLLRVDSGTGLALKAGRVLMISSRMITVRSDGSYKHCSLLAALDKWAP